MVYNGDRKAPPDLSNLLLEGTDLDPDTWLMCHMLILAFLPRIANSSNIQQQIFLRESVHIYKILRVLDITKFHPNVRIVCRLWYTGEMSPELEKPPTRKDTVVFTTTHKILCNVHSVSQWQIPHSQIKVKTHNSLFITFSYSDPTLVIKASVPQCQKMAQDSNLNLLSSC